MELEVVTAAERPDVEGAIGELTAEVWPPFMLEDPVADRHWGRLYDTFGGFQLTLVDQAGQTVAAGNAIPLTWDGAAGDLPDGWDDALERGVDNHRQGRPPDTLCALAATVGRRHQGTGASRLVIGAMRALAVQARLARRLAPGRPSWKHRYPLIPIERYVGWTRPDGSLFDPWLRVHASEGATLLAVAPRSMVIPGTVAQWEEWAAMPLPDSGSYVVPGALTPVLVDRERDLAEYVEPNVWMRHPL
jgi:hypothetical protein